MVAHRASNDYKYIIIPPRPDDSQTVIFILFEENNFDLDEKKVAGQHRTSCETSLLRHEKASKGNTG